MIDEEHVEAWAARAGLSDRIFVVSGLRLGVLEFIVQGQKMHCKIGGSHSAELMKKTVGMTEVASRNMCDTYQQTNR